VPVNWDETKVLDSKIGDYVIIARRNKQNWFVGAITDENSRNFEIPLTFLAPEFKYKVKIYSDGKNADWENNPTEIEISDQIVEKGDLLPIKLAKGGGMALQFSLITNKDIK